MSTKRTILTAGLLILVFVGGIVQGRTERFELEGNMKLFGNGNGIIFPDDTKLTSAAIVGVAVYTRTQMVQPGGSVLAVAGQADCDAGDIVVGGGVSFAQAGTLTQVIYSIVNEASGPGTAWVGQVVANPNSAGFAAGSTLTISARCADVTP